LLASLVIVYYTPKLFAISTKCPNVEIGGYANTKCSQSIVKEQNNTNSDEEVATQAEPFSISEELEEIIAVEEVRTNMDPESSQLPRPPSILEQCKPWRANLRSELAYKYLCGLVCALACALVATLLDAYCVTGIPGRAGGLARLASPKGLQGTLQAYLSWIAVDIAILLLASFCFVENMSSSRYKLRARFAHFVYLSMSIVFVGMSVGFYVALFFHFIL
jgi:hypothetical protein